MLPLALVVAMVATLDSLYLSEVAHFEPCRLCWYQRIAMYPLAQVLGVAVVRHDQEVRPSALALAVAPCRSRPTTTWWSGSRGWRRPAAARHPCSIVWVWHFHYISIRLMAASAFALIAALLLLMPAVGGAGDHAGRSRPARVTALDR